MSFTSKWMSKASIVIWPFVTVFVGSLLFPLLLHAPNATMATIAVVRTPRMRRRRDVIGVRLATHLAPRPDRSRCVGNLSPHVGRPARRGQTPDSHDG